MTRRVILGGLTLLGVLVAAQPSEAQRELQLGTINFPTSARSDEAQALFIRGTTLLHSFEWEDAAETFRQAQEIEPDFAMAYWGEALSYTEGHHFPAGQNLPAARQALARLGETRAERAAKAPTAREKAYLYAVEVLYGAGDGLERSLAYSEAMGQMYRDDPDDLEAAAFYALSLMRTVRRGEGSIRQDMQAGSIAQAVFRENPDHPGAAHYVIHAFDDPVHAPVALYAALKYADIAPAAVHALHMPSHIFVQHGMWDYLAASNKASWDASVVRATRKGLSPTRYSFHALYWLQYAYLQQGLYDKAEECLDEIRAVTALPDVRPGTEATQAIMEARQTLATRQWQVPSDLEQLVERILDDPSQVRSHAAGAVLLAAGISAARLGDVAAAELAEQGAREVHEYLDAMGRENRSVTQAAVTRKEIEAMARLAKGDSDAAVRLLQDATAIEETMVPPSGPPGERPTDGPIKPSHELLGEVLLELDRPAEAAEQFADALLRMPHRPLSVLGAARAAAGSGDAATARAHYQEVVTLWDGSREGDTVAEAKRFLSQTEEP